MSSSKINVLMVLNENPLNPNGGLGLYIKEVCDRLSKNKLFNITVVGSDHATQEGSFYIVGDKISQVNSYTEWRSTEGCWRLMNIFNHNHVYTRDGFITSLILRDNFLSNLLQLKNEKFDIIHMHDATLWNAVKHIKFIFNAPIVFTTHLNSRLSSPIFPQDSRYMYNIQNERDAYLMSDKILTVSKSYGEELKKIYMIDNIDVIHNGVDYESLSKIKYDVELRKEFDDRPLVVFVGRFVHTKGVTHLFRAVYELPEINFLFISVVNEHVKKMSPLFKKMEQIIRTHKNFKFYNQNDNDLKLRYMKIADIGVVPSLHEPFGIIALEWMSLGVPLIAYNTGGLPEFCNNENSTVIRPEIEHLVQALKTHVRNENKIKQGLETAKYFNWEKVAGELSNIYKEVNKKWHVQ
jgi:glycosyltransferase involved in cell wall biosynthesis